MYLDDRRRFMRDIELLGSENWYIWLNPDERQKYSEIGNNYMDSFGNITPKARSVILNLIKVCQERANDSDRNRVNQGAFRSGK